METLPHEKQIVEFEKTVAKFREQNHGNDLLSVEELEKLEQKLDKLKEKIYSKLTPWDRVQICRHPNRPHAIDFIKNICEDFVELCGDRLFREDPAVVGGLAKMGGRKVMIIGQEKGCDTKSRLYRNFGMLHPEGFRKALRLAKMAEKFHIPVIFLLDTPGAYPGLAAEERGQGWAIAQNLRDLSRLRTVSIVIVIGEGCSGGALGMGIGDVVGMLEHAYYSVISPEGCASILWKDPSKNSQAAASLRMQAEDLLDFEIVDEIIKEPLGGAHHDPKLIFESVTSFIIHHLDLLGSYPLDILLERRYQKFRKIGRFNETTAESSTS
jgi:acetyl-CoA carboxylase carboxyl transferase subunit alpha